MAFEVILPKQGWSMEEATFIEWLKQDGQSVAEGEPLFSVETDKAEVEIEALDSGILHIRQNGPQSGDLIAVGDVLGHLLSPGESAVEENTATNDSAENEDPPPTSATDLENANGSPTQKPSAATAATTIAPPIRAARKSNGTAVSPRAARRALQDGIDLRTVTGSGHAGCIREADVIAAAADCQTPATPCSPANSMAGSSADLGSTGCEIPLSSMRRKIADRMHHSKTVTAPVTLTTRADAGELVQLRTAFKATAQGSGEAVPGYNDMLIKLVAAALQQHPALNACSDGGRIVQPDAVNISLAVETEQGLLTPVVRDVPSLSLRELAAQTLDLAKRARQRRLSPDELAGGTFTVTNLGAAGVDAFTPIINHPQCAILGIGRIVREPVAVDGEVVVGNRIWLSLTFDHRIVDGGPAARFLDTLRHTIEDPARRLTE